MDFDEATITDHYIGKLEEECIHCYSKYFKAERTQDGKYSSCCLNGSYKLPCLQAYPEPLKKLITLPSEAPFKQKIRYVNYSIHYCFSVSFTKNGQIYI